MKAFRIHMKETQGRKWGGKLSADQKRREIAPKQAEAVDAWRTSKLSKRAFSMMYAKRFDRSPEAVRGWLKGVRRSGNGSKKLVEP